ncbi:MAG: hypothetical protein AB7G10_02250 [Reyranellaceae bacterium]
MSLLQRARERRAGAARARRLSNQLLSEPDRANIAAYADWLEAEAEALERAAAAVPRAKQSRGRSSH